MKIYRQLFFISLISIGTTVFAQQDTLKKVTKPTGFDRTKMFGLALGVGTTNFKVTNSNWKQGTINYNDSLKSITPQSGFKLDLTLFYFMNFNKNFAFRPATTLSFEGAKVQYNKYQSFETVDASTVSQMVSLPFLFKVPGKNVQPYIVAGPTFLYMLGQDNKINNLPLKTVDLLCDVGLGIDIDMPKLKIIATPEFKYSAGLLNRKGDANNLYINTIEQLKRTSFTFSICLRDR